MSVYSNPQNNKKGNSTFCLFGGYYRILCIYR